MIAALYSQTKSTTMKKLLIMTVFAAFTALGVSAQTSGNSTYGHSHKKTKKAKKHHKTYNTTAADRKAINVQHKTTVRTIRQDNALTNEQQKNQVKQANVAHKQEMKTVTLTKAKGKK